MLATRAAVLLLATCAVPCVAQEPRELLRQQVLRTAERYATFEWTASEANVHHGLDADGVRIDTPDRGFDPAGWLADGSSNRGMPYAWGGFSTIEQFVDGLQQRRFAGLVPKSERASASRFALGVDCSGYVARCLDVPVKQSTRSLGQMCYVLESCDELRPGDLLNKFDEHVVMFAGWIDAERTKMNVFEAATLRVQQSTYTVADLQRSGFVPMRYRLLDARWRAMDASALGKPAWQHSDSAPGRFVAAAAEAPRDADAQPLRNAAAGQWLRFSAADGTVHTLLAAAVTAEHVELQRITTIDGKPLPAGQRLARSDDAARVLVDLLAYPEPLTIREVAAHDVAAGELAHGGRNFAARRHRWQLAGDTVVRHRSYPMWLDVTAVFADGVPLLGLVSAEFELTIDWQSQGRATAQPVRSAVVLDAFGASR